MDKVRCPGCKGAKKVPKLGGMLGECNQCVGTGSINAADKVIPAKINVVEEVNPVIKAVADCVPSSDIQHKADIETLPVAPDVKINGKKANFRRKKA